MNKPYEYWILRKKLSIITIFLNSMLLIKKNVVILQPDFLKANIINL